MLPNPRWRRIRVSGVLAVKKQLILHFSGLKSTSCNTQQHWEAGKFWNNANFSEFLRRFWKVQESFVTFRNFLDSYRMFTIFLKSSLFFSESEKFQKAIQKFLKKYFIKSRQDMRGGPTSPSCPLLCGGLFAFGSTLSRPPHPAATDME
jgi:hypothetical protein